MVLFKYLLLSFSSFVICFTVHSGSEAKDILIEISNRQVYIALPEHESNSYDKLRVLMAIHGNGREALSYFPGQKESIPFYVYQRDLALKNGFLFVVVSNGMDTWGTERGMEVLLKVHDYITNHFSVQKQWVLWGTSAGGLQMFRMIKEHPDIVDRVIGTFPVYDLLQAFEKRKEGGFIWKTPESFEKINPANYPESLTAVPMLIFHGRSDAVVPCELHSERLRDEVNKRGGKVKLITVRGGHSTTNWNVYDEKRISRFLQSKI